MVVEYNTKYDEDIKDLLVELQEYIQEIDVEGYNIVTEEYREECFKDNLKEINENDGKMLLYKENNKIVGFVIGIKNKEENSYDFKCPMRGTITELIVSKKDDEIKKLRKDILMKIVYCVLIYSSRWIR